MVSLRTLAGGTKLMEGAGGRGQRLEESSGLHGEEELRSSALAHQWGGDRVLRGRVHECANQLSGSVTEIQ